MSEPVAVFTLSQRQRLEHLVGSWELRARANMMGTEGNVLRDNIAALKAAVSTADLSAEFRKAWNEERERSEKASLIVEEVRMALDDFAAFRGPRPKRIDMARLSNRLQAAFEELGNP